MKTSRLVLLFLGLLHCSPPMNNSMEGGVATDAMGGSDAVTSDAPPANAMAVRIRFAASVGDETFACNRTFMNVGTSRVTWTPEDFRLYVHNVRLVTADGREASVFLDEDGQFQAQGAALLDFEDATGRCMGNAVTHTELTGRVAEGTYTGLRFTVGLPPSLNHQDVSVAVAPFNLTAMFWNWNGGYRFMKIDGRTPNVPGYLVHLGSTGCRSEATGVSLGCTAPNRVEVSLENFSVANSTVVADLGALLADSDVNTNTELTNPGCMSVPADPDCRPIFARLGLPFNNAPAMGAQRFFRLR